jgi:hypothetical protein
MEWHQLHTVDFDFAGANPIAIADGHSRRLPESDGDRDVTRQHTLSKLGAELHGLRVFAPSRAAVAVGRRPVQRFRQRASMIGRYARHGPTASEYCFAIVLTI